LIFLQRHFQPHDPVARTAVHYIFKHVTVLLSLQAIVPAIDSPDDSSHFGIFRFPSDAILTFPKAKKCFTLPNMWLHCPQCNPLHFQLCEPIARDAIHYISNRVTLLHYFSNVWLYCPHCTPLDFQTSSIPRYLTLLGGWALVQTH
jgi:hypothetical protein